MLLEEPFSADDRPGSRRRLKSMLRELRDQAEVALHQEMERGEPRDTVGFTVYPDGGLDLLLHAGACIDLSCRLAQVDRFARSLGLLADKAVLTDTLTPSILDIGRPTNAAIDQLLDDIFVLQRLRPMLAANIVSFRPRQMPLCSACGKEFNRRIDDTANQLLGRLSSRIDIRPSKKGEFSVSIEPLYDPPIVFLATNLMPERDPLDVARDVIREAVRDAMLAASMAARGGGTVFSNSRVGLAGLMLQEGWRNPISEIERWDISRTADLPWVSHLSVEEVLIVRQEAAKALPRFRELLRDRIGAQVLDGNSGRVPRSGVSPQARQVEPCVLS